MDQGYDDKKDAEKVLYDSIRQGLTMPIEEIEQVSKEILPKGDGIVNTADIWLQMQQDFIHGKNKGTTTYFPRFDGNWKWKKGETTLFFGIPNHGKSQFVLQLMLIKSVNEKTKWAVFSPEGYPPNDFYEDLCHSYLGRQIGDWVINGPSMIEYKRAFDFIREHFFYIYPDTIHTPENINANFEWAAQHLGVEGVLIDPFNQLVVNLEGLRDDIYISNFLTERKRLAMKYNLYDLLVVHPSRLKRIEKLENYPMPNIYEISGGAMWANKADNIIIIYRPLYYTEPTNSTVEIVVSKIRKQKLVGKPGRIEMDFNQWKARYYEDGRSPFEGEMIQQQFFNNK